MDFERLVCLGDQAQTGMERIRCGITRTLMLLPILLTAFVAIYARSYQDDYVVPENTEAQDQAMLKYAPLVKDTEATLRTEDEAREWELLRVARKWDEGFRFGHLQPLTPASYEDWLPSGARAQVIASQQRLVIELLRHAKKPAVGDSQIKIEEAILALRLAEGLKHSDFRTARENSLKQRQAIQTLQRLAIAVDPQTQARIADEIALVAVNNQRLERLTLISRQQFYDYMERYGTKPVSIEDVRRTEYVTRRLIAAPTAADSLMLLRGPLYSSAREHDDYSPSVLTELRLAWNEHELLAKAAQAILNALPGGG